MKMNSNVWAKTAKKVNDFYASSIAIIFFMSMTTIFAFLQIILYSLNVMEVNGHNIKNVPGNGVGNWFLLTFSIIGCYCGFVGGIMLFRGSLSFVYWQNTSTTLAVLTQALASMWFGAFVSVYFIFMNTIRFWAWKNNKLDDWDWSSSKIVTIGLIYWVILIIIMYLLCGFVGEDLYANAKWMETRNYYFDATGASLNMTASLMMLFKSRWAFVFYAIAKIFTIWNYADAGLIVPIVQMMLFWVMDFTGFIGWSIHEEDPVEIPFDEEHISKKEVL